MKYIIEHETDRRIRISLHRKISAEEAKILTYTLSSIDGVSDVRIYAAAGGIAIIYSGDRKRLLEKLDHFSYRNVTYFAQKEETAIDAQEVQRRKLDPALKRRLRRRILVETAADVIMPMPVQIAYHLYQMITLKNL